MVKEWIYNEITDRIAIAKLKKELKISPVLCGILYRKGITNIDDARAYFKPVLSELHDPFLMKDMDKAVERLKTAVENNEKILVYGDYDVDGTTSVGMMTLFLRNLTSNIDYYLPDRYTEGYGISEAGVIYAIKGGFSLIISLDCGIRANKNVKYASDNGIDFIICDHHLPGSELPVAKAVLDPKRSDCDYPFKELSGCGIGFKFMQAYGLATGISDKSIYEYLDLVAVSICADIVPITGENRILTYYGLRKLNISPLPGFAGLIRTTGRRKTFKVSDVVFGIAPRINAAGRMKHAREAVQLLLADTDENIEQGANRLNELNTERRSSDQETTQEAIEMIQQNSELQNTYSSVLYNESWNKGVIGIVASRLIEQYYRPTIILTKSNGMATGSARSVKGFNVYEAISACSDLLTQFGGHKYAAGLTMELVNIQQFIERFETIVSSTINKNDLVPKINIDDKINFDEIDLKFFRIMEGMEPFGPGNPTPTFVSEDVFCKSARVVGENHLKMLLVQMGSKNKFEAIAFKMSGFENEVSRKKPFNIAFHLELNDFQGEESLQLVIKDMKFKD